MFPFVPRQSAEAHVTCMCRKEIAWKDMDDWRTLVHEHAIDFNKETSLKVSCPVGFFLFFLGPGSNLGHFSPSHQRGRCAEIWRQKLGGVGMGS